MITTEQVKELRDKTGVSIMQCKKALEEAGGDMEKALQVLKQKSAAQAAKKADRELGAGIVHAYIHSNKSIGVLLELNCETDFVAQNQDFITLANDISMHIAAMAPEFISLEHISDSEKEKVKAIFQEEIDALDKPEDIKAKILEGKVSDYFGSRTLLTQPFIKNPDTTIAQLIDEAIQKIGEKIELARFVRYGLLENVV